jgi:hypothetical protein
MTKNIKYEIEDYNSNINITVIALDDNDEEIDRNCINITCTSDEPKSSAISEDEDSEELEVTRASELGSYLRGLSDKDMAKWLDYNGY